MKAFGKTDIRHRRSRHRVASCRGDLLPGDAEAGEVLAQAVGVIGPSFLEPLCLARNLQPSRFGVNRVLEGS